MQQYKEVNKFKMKKKYLNLKMKKELKRKEQGNKK